MNVTESLEPEPEEAFSGVESDGYGVQVLGGVHRTSTDGAHFVELSRDRPFKLRLRNDNHHCCMVDVSVDRIIVGRFLLQAFTEFDIERPIDRPLNFTYSPVEGSDDRKEKRNESMQYCHGTVTCSFAPEEGSKVIQLDVKIHHTNRTQRLEMLNDSTVSDLYNELEADIGTWVEEPGFMLISWCSAEYDSPVDDVLGPFMQTSLGSYRRADEPVRRMSLMHINRVEVILPLEAVSVTLTFDALPTVGAVLQGLRMENRGLPEEWYLLSDENRLLCSSAWAQDRIAIPHLMHKDEILRDLSALHLKFLPAPPPGVFVIYIRLMSGQLFELEACAETTIRECQYQLEVRGGPWGRGPKWLYGGTLLDDKHTLDHYGIASKNTLDVVLRLQDGGEKRPVHIRQPVAVECKACTAALLHDTPTAGNKPKEKGNRKFVQRRTTTLRGRSVQQFVEVDPIIVDERFRRDIHITLIPKTEPEESATTTQASVRKKSGCQVM